LVRLQAFPWEITKNSNRGLRNFLPEKVFFLVPFESLTSISLPGSPDKASFCQEIWSNCGNFHVFTTSVPNMRVNFASFVTNLGSRTCKRFKSSISR